jgi:hypothetical protein
MDNGRGESDAPEAIICDENQATPCCRRYSRPDEQCDRYPACDPCEHLIADDGPVVQEPSQQFEASFAPVRLESGPPAEPRRDPLY